MLLLTMARLVVNGMMKGIEPVIGGKRVKRPNIWKAAWENARLLSETLLVWFGFVLLISTR